MLWGAPHSSSTVTAVPFPGRHRAQWAGAGFWAASSSPTTVSEYSTSSMVGSSSWSLKSN